MEKKYNKSRNLSRQKTSLLRRDILAIVSHELRTSLHAIIGYNDCLLREMDGPINEAQREILKKIEKSSLHLLFLLNDILDLAKCEAKKIKLEIFPQNIVDLVISCIEEMQPLAKQKNLLLSFSSEQPNILIEMDSFRIRQVILNLLNNAIKFTQSGSIEVKIKQTQNKATVSVSDTGVGLTQNELKKIFTPFSQANPSISRKFGGSGLGLSISKKLIDLHKGKISVKSTKGVGSTFSFALPKRMTNE